MLFAILNHFDDQSARLIQILKEIIMPYKNRITQLALIVASLMTIGTATAQNKSSDVLQDTYFKQGELQDRRGDWAEQRGQRRENRAERRDQRRDNRAERKQGRATRMSGGGRTSRSRR